MILSKRMADHKPHDMICELVDNALDAGARRVWIELGRRSITVGDDGEGMEDVNDAIRFGKGTKATKRGSVLGRYGVGMTDALCKLGPKATVTTLRGGALHSLRADWEECLRNDHFPYLDDGKPRRTKDLAHFADVAVDQGTCVKIHGQPPGVQMEKLRRILTERYTPGIWQGREIRLRRERHEWTVVEDMDPGELCDTIEYDGEIEGLPYHVYGGLMKQRNVVYNRVFIGYAYRFVEDTTELFKGLSTAHLQVFLGEPWKECLGTHKNRLERFRDELFDDIRSRAKDWFESAAEKAEALQLGSLALELEQYLAKTGDPSGAEPIAASIRDASVPKSAKPAAASPRPTRPTPPTREATGTPEAATRRPSRGIAIVWDAGLRQMGELSVSDDGDVRVTLNPDDARVRVLRERRDCPGLVHIISAYIAHYASLSDENARQLLRAGIVRAAEPGFRAHELFAYYYDRVDQPAVSHEGD